MFSLMTNLSQTIVWIIAVALGIAAAVAIDGSLIVSILVGGGVAAVVALVGTLILGKRTT